ncbi:MAG: ATP-binding cassette domain-containing protein, partial [Spirochaetales bacterium]|nr:ATP-binding cassette domain-containing protein [Spirochaetales bacterium]
MSLINVDDLKVYFSGQPRMFGRKKHETEVVHAVDGVTFHILEGEILSLVGESGCGKTTTGMGVLRLVDVYEGSVTFRGEDILAMSSRELRQFRSKAQMIFQATISSLDPRMTVREIVSEPLRIHGMAKDEDRINDLVIETLD